MRRLILGLFFLALVPTLGFAQTSNEYGGQGYLFFAPGGTSPGNTANLHFGGAGGEGLIYKGLGVGGELGYLTPWQGFRSGVGVLSLNGSYNFF